MSGSFDDVELSAKMLNAHEHELLNCYNKNWTNKIQTTKGSNMK
jgi:hypothetical protein